MISNYWEVPWIAFVKKTGWLCLAAGRQEKKRKETPSDAAQQKHTHPTSHTSLQDYSPSRGNRAPRTLLHRTVVLVAVTHLPLAGHINPNDYFDSQTRTLRTPCGGALQQLNFWPLTLKSFFKDTACFSTKRELPSKQTIQLKSLSNINSVDVSGSWEEQHTKGPSLIDHTLLKEEQRRCCSTCLSTLRPVGQNTRPENYFMVQATRFQSAFAREGSDQVSTLFFPLRAVTTKERYCHWLLYTNTNKYMF